jgi:lysozyme
MSDDLEKSFEGCSLVAYQDVVGVWTIGYGHTHGVAPGMTCTQEQADAWLSADLASAIAAVHDLVKVPLTPDQRDALEDFVYNLGERALAGSTLLRLLNAGEYELAAQQFELWDHAGGKVVAGLLRRRLAEDAEFSGSA